jgi:Zn-dependent protease with chaperone function
MNREEFDVHVQAIEQRYRGRQRALRMRLLRLAALGYAGLLAGFFVAFLLAALFLIPALRLPLEEGWPFWLLGAGALFGGGLAMTRALSVGMAPPEGRVLTEAEAPALFALLEELRGKLQAGRFYRVVITGECNAGVMERPRLGLLGWPRHWLLLGLPLLESLTAPELRAVLAHEFAHLSRRHGRFNNWFYRLRRSWEQVFARLHFSSGRRKFSLRPLLLKFIDWFWPRFNAHAFVLSRADEYEADAVAADLAGPDNVATSLLRVELHSRLLEQKFWPDLWLQANRTSEIPENVFAQLRGALHAPPPAEAAIWLEQAFRWTTSNVDTHPCLSERLRAVGRLPDGVEHGRFPAWPVQQPRSAADDLLGPVLEQLRADVEVAWRKESLQNWSIRHARAAALNDRLARMDTSLPTGTDADGLWDKAEVMMKLEGESAAAPLLRQLLELSPEHVGANFIMGRHLLMENDPAGEAYLERAIALEEDATSAACELLLIHFRRLGQKDRVRETETRLDRYEEALSASHKERMSVTRRDAFIPHTLTAEELGAVRALLASEPEIRSADLAQKQMGHFPKQRLFVLCLRRRRAWYQLPNADKEQALINRLLPKIRLPGRKLVISPRGGFRSIASRVARVSGARIFRPEDLQIR